MAKFDRYTDGENRLFIVIAQWSKADKQANGEYIFTPTTVDLLDVYNKKCNEISVEDFEKYVSKGLLKFNG